MLWAGEGVPQVLLTGKILSVPRGTFYIKSVIHSFIFTAIDQFGLYPHIDLKSDSIYVCMVYQKAASN